MADKRGSVLARWLGVLRLSRRQLQQRWLESVLIMLGIALGVGVLTAGETFVRFQQSMVTEVLGAAVPEWRAVSIQPRMLNPVEDFYGQNPVPAVRITADMLEAPAEITVEDVLALRRDVPGVEHVTVVAGTRETPIVAFGDRTITDDTNVLLEGVTPDHFAFQGMEFVAGGPFTWDDFDMGQPRVVVEAESVARLFPDVDPVDLIGQNIYTTGVRPGDGDSGTPWQVVGVVTLGDDASLTRSLFAGQESNSLRAYQPVTANPGIPLPAGAVGVGRIPGITFFQVYVTPRDEGFMNELIAEVEAYFDQKYGVGRINVQNPVEQRGAATAELGPIIVALLVLAGLGLIIAAVNVLNLFTARVLRRQRITGMSVALGATRRLLFWQTAGEALLLGAVGSAFGLALASGLVAGLRSLLMADAGELAERALFMYAGFRLGAPDVLVGLAAGIGLSLIFGLYPAWLGSRQDPVEALRVE